MSPFTPHSNLSNKTMMKMMLILVATLATLSSASSSFSASEMRDHAMEYRMNQTRSLINATEKAITWSANRGRCSGTYEYTSGTFEDSMSNMTDFFRQRGFTANYTAVNSHSNSSCPFLKNGFFTYNATISWC